MIILDKDEHIIFQIRQHWFIFVAEITMLLFLALLPAIIIGIVSTLPIELDAAGRSVPALITFFYTAWLFVLWIVGFIFWTDYYLDTWIITNHKVIDVEQSGMFQREISVLHIDKIQDVTSEVTGMLATLINYGDIYIQTAGQQREFVIKNVPKPDEIRQKLSEIIVRHHEYIAAKTAQTTRAL